VVDSASGSRVYHRLESPTQTPADAARQQATGEIWGRPAQWSLIPKVKAYRGPLPAGARGIEFVTDVPPDVGSARLRVDWSGPRPGVRVEGDVAKIEVIVTKNTQA
jgi:hypothetical protein